MRSTMRPRALMMAVASALALGLAACGPEQATNQAPNPNAAAEIAKFLDSEIGDMSTLDRAAQEAELTWFATAAAPFQGMEINVVSENDRDARLRVESAGPGFLRDHRHQGHPPHLIGEGDVVDRLQRQMQSGENSYDAYVNDSDLIGTHWRYQQVRDLTDWMANEGKDVTSPDARPGRLHRRELHDWAGWQALPASRPAVREPLLVPL
jgi:glycerol transport system substrate-binding protein